MQTVRTYVGNLFGDLLNSMTSYETTALTSGYPSAKAWKTSAVNIPNELMINGCCVYSPTSDGSTVPSKYTSEHKQLALFKVAPKYIKAAAATIKMYKSSTTWTDTVYQNYWLKDNISAALVACVDENGRPSTTSGSSETLGIRPYVVIG